jgi:hypothetical protein
MPLDPHRTQEQSIKARKSQLFDADEPEVSTDGPRQSFQECLRTTPAEPLSTMVKVLLWTVGTVVILLLIVALATGGPRKPKRKPVVSVVPSPSLPGTRRNSGLIFV